MIARIVTSIRRNAIAWLALFVALTGTSMAASHYVVSSTKQIKPSVIKKLRGNRGPAGAQGAAGPQGTAGKEGVGSQGVRGPTGPSGSTGTKGTSGVTGPEGPTGPGVGATGPTGASGTNGSTGPTGATGSTGATGNEGEPGSGGVKAYAHIAANGKYTESSGFTGVPNPVIHEPENKKEKEAEPGVYCITGLGFTPKNAVVTVDANETGGENSIPAAPVVHIEQSTSSSCPGTTQITVETDELGFEKVGSAFELVEEGANEGFYIQIN